MIPEESFIVYAKSGTPVWYRRSLIFMKAISRPTSARTAITTPRCSSTATKLRQFYPVADYASLIL